jgi:hypothetical protein
MYFTINELSFQQVSNNFDANEVLIEFSQVSNTLFKLGFRKMKLWNKSVFLNFEIAPSVLIIDWIKAKHENKKLKLSAQILKLLINKSSLYDWDAMERNQISECPLIGININGSERVSEGIKIACLNNSITISLNTNPFWNVPFLNLIWIDEIDGKVMQQDIELNHASTVTHIDSHKDWLSNLVSTRKLNQDWKPNEFFFPCLDFSNMLVPDGDWKFFQNEVNKAVSMEHKRAIIISYGRKVAERNLYKFDKKTSDLNSTSKKKRLIFSAGVAKNRIYLSIDIKKGAFEVCDYSGNHLGEYAYNGIKIKDSQADHGIKIT